jgi:hemolysin D
MPLGGIADKILVKDGDKVKAGQVVMRLDTEASAQKLKSLRESLELKETQLALKRLELQRFLSLRQDTLGTLKQRVAFEREIMDRLASLAKVGASSELQYLQQRNTVQEVEGRLRESRLDGLRLEAIQQQDIQRLRSELSDLRSQLTEINVTLRYQALRSPVDGIVFDLKPKSPGYAAQSTEAVMKIVPFNAMEARVEIPSSKIGFVLKGMPVDISIDSFPASDFGVLEGSVRQLGSDALPPDPAKQQTEYRYPALIQLASQQLKLKGGQRLPLQVGMSLTANIKLRKVSYLQMLLGGFRDKAGSLQRI